MMHFSRRWPLCGLLFLVCLCSNLGCSWNKRASNDTPVTNDSRIIYTSILKELITLKQLGFISDAEKIEIDSVRKQTATALDAMEQAELNGLSINLSRETFSKLIDQLIAWRIKAQARREASRKAFIFSHESVAWIRFYTQQSLDSFSGAPLVGVHIKSGRNTLFTSQTMFSGRGTEAWKAQRSPRHC